MKKRLVAMGLAGGLLVGGAVGAAFGVPGISGAQDSTTTAPSTQAPATGQRAADGTFHSNEDPAHEAAETPEQEAAEDNGTFHGGHGRGHGGPGHSNEDPAHEAAETPEQEAAEDAGKAPAPAASSTAPAQTSNSNTRAAGSRSTGGASF